MSESKGGDKNPIIARYSIDEGIKLDNYNSYYIAGANGSRDSYVQNKGRKLLINSELPKKINLRQSDDILPHCLPSLCGAGGVLIASDSIRHSFILYDCTNKAKSYETYPLEGGFIRDASDPVWDGLFFNVILKNKIYRYGLSRLSELREHCFQYTNYDIDEKIQNPLVIFNNEQRLLAFATKQKMFVCDISNYKGEKKPHEIELKHKEIFPLLQYKDKIIAVSKRGGIYKVDINNPIELSPLFGAEEYEFSMISYPIILRDNLYYLFKNKNDDNKFYIRCFNLDKNSERNTEINTNGYSYSERFLLHDGYRIILKNNFGDNNYLKINENGIANEIKIPRDNEGFTINIDDFIIYDNKIYSFEETRRTIYVADMKTLQYNASMNISYNMAEDIKPLSNITFFDGIIALMTDTGIFLNNVG